MKKNTNIGFYRLFIAGIVIVFLNSCGKDVTEIVSPIPERYTAIAAGQLHSLALGSDGGLWIWGSYQDGQLGNGLHGNASGTWYTLFFNPEPGLLGTGYSDIAAGSNHSLAIKKDGTLWAWGDNLQGQVGDGTNVDKSTPVFIGSGYTKITGGTYHTLALKADHTLWIWGISKLNPELLGTDYIKIDAGYKHSLALKTDGTLWAWGSNSSGALGTGGDSTNSSSPIQIK